MVQALACVFLTVLLPRAMNSSKDFINDNGLNSHLSALIQNLDGVEKEAVARQYIPDMQELNIRSDESSDPISDEKYTPINGIVHRYPDRVLFKVSNVCDVYCRYCFRREMIGVGVGSSHLSDNDFDEAIKYIKSHKEIWEVILTGGDPLILSPRRLQKIFDCLGEIDHVQVIRIHTRIPISNPTKINDMLPPVLKSVSKAVHIVLHVNHTVEINDNVGVAIKALRAQNCSILSQSVLLKGVNDDAKTLEELFKKLITLHVKPYYLHHMDRAIGTSHFRVSIKRGQEIMKDLQGRVSGICLPKYMLDIPDGFGKIPIDNGYINALDDGNKYNIEDYQGCTHIYSDEI